MSGQQACVLFVETDIIVRAEIADAIRECGYRVVEAANTDEALNLLSNNDLRIDVLMVDMRAAGQEDGFGLARWVRINRKDIDIILGGSLERLAEDVDDLCSRGSLLPSPFQKTAVVDRIKLLMAQRERSR